MTKLTDRLFNRREAFKVTAVEASRAMFESEDIQRIDIRLTLEGDNRLTLELTPKQAHRLIEQLGIAYNAINPPPPRTGYAQGWGMQ